MTQSKVKSKGEFAIPQNENEFQEKIKKRLEGRSQFLVVSSVFLGNNGGSNFESIKGICRGAR